MDLTITFEDDLHGDELRQLRAWLVDVAELRGRVHLVQSSPEPDALGADVSALLVALGPGGAMTALAGAVIAWVRHQSSDVTLKVTRSGKHQVSVSVEARRVKRLDAEALQAQVTSLVEAMGEGTASGRSAIDG
jgi:hypothetical protein